MWLIVVWYKIIIFFENVFFFCKVVYIVIFNLKFEIEFEKVFECIFKCNCIYNYSVIFYSIYIRVFKMFVF